MIDPEKLTTFLEDARGYNREAYEKSEFNGVSDPYWMGRMAMCNTVLEWLKAGLFEGDE